ncbi:serine/threonine protein kinase, partial [Myxococcus sp. 1LA]
PPSRQEAPPEPESFDEPSDLQTQRFRSRPPRPSAEGARRPARPGASEAVDTPVETPVARPPSRWMGRLFLLLVLGGLGWAATLPAVRAQLQPAFESAKAWVSAELNTPSEEDPANQPWPPQQAGPPPGFRRQEPEPERPQAPAEPEAVVQAEPSAADEEPANPEAAPPPKTATARKAKEGSSPARWASAPKAEPDTSAKAAPTAGGTPIAGAKAAPASGATPPASPPPRVASASPAAEPVTTVTQDPEGMAEVLDTSTAKGAAKAGLGWMTLYTVPRAAVFDGATELGTTPLRKFPLPVGVYRLRVVDPTGVESESRLLSAPIKPGEETKIQIRLADLPLYKE